MRHIGVTGTQRGMTRLQRVTANHLLYRAARPLAVHIGDCIGVDTEMFVIAKTYGMRTVGHQPIDPKKRAFLIYDEERPEKPYLERNHEIVNEAEQLIAVPKEYAEELRSGTWATVRYALKRLKQVLIVWPDGRVEIR
jgi:hypothetical protein